MGNITEDLLHFVAHYIDDRLKKFFSKKMFFSKKNRKCSKFLFVAIACSERCLNCLVLLLHQDLTKLPIRLNILPIRLALCSVLQGYLLVSKLC